MRHPNFKEEKILWKRGYKIVVGIDEVGRGPLAGPVVAAAFCFKIDGDPGLRRIRDSKQLTAKQREKIYETLKNNSDAEWGIGRVSEKVIDKINILQATKLAMQKAVKDLEKNLKKWLVQKKCDRINFAPNSFLIIDGNFGLDINIPQKSIIKADEKVFSVAAASIVAKVTRDRMMMNYHKKYPDYGFDKHKGYGTKLHRELIKKYSFCKIHRKSFRIS